MEKEATIYDIARSLNVSIATVSRALNEDPVVSKKTRKRVFEAAEALGYRHNRFASILRTRKTNIIGVIVPKLNSSFIANVLAGIEKAATEAGYDLIIATSSEKMELEKANANNMFHKRVDGLIVSLAIDSTDLRHFDQFTAKGIPVVFFDRVMEQEDAIQVVIDNQKCGYQLARHLMEQGCTQIAHITGSLSRNVYNLRYKGYLQAMQEAGKSPTDDLLVVTDLSEEGAITAVNSLLDRPDRPDAIMVTNDFMAAVVMNELKIRGLRIPYDIAITGFNNDAISRLVEPKLTTIDYPGLDMGKIIAHNLLGYLAGDENIRNTTKVIIRSQLLVRQSSLKKAK